MNELTNGSSIEPFEIFQSTPPDGLTIVLGTLWADRVLREKKAEAVVALKGVVDWLDEHPTFLESAPCKFSGIVVSSVIPRLQQRGSIAPEQIMWWMHRKCYIQIGFLGNEYITDVNAQGQLIWDMTQFDGMAAITGFDLARERCLAVTGVKSLGLPGIYERPSFLDGHGFWCKALIEVRNKLLIASRSLVLGLNPEIEYERFIAAGGTYFLNYPDLNSGTWK